MKLYYQRLRELREDNDLTQEQVARLLGTSQTMYARYERGANELPIRHLVSLCELFNVSADEMLAIKKDSLRAKGQISVEVKRQFNTKSK